MRCLGREDVQVRGMKVRRGQTQVQEGSVAGGSLDIADESQVAVRALASTRESLGGRCVDQVVLHRMQNDCGLPAGGMIQRPTLPYQGSTQTQTNRDAEMKYEMKTASRSSDVPDLLFRL